MLRIIFDNCTYEIVLYSYMIIREEVDRIEDLEGRDCLYYELV